MNNEDCKKYLTEVQGLKFFNSVFDDEFLDLLESGLNVVFISKESDYNLLRAYTHGVVFVEMDKMSLTRVSIQLLGTILHKKGIKYKVLWYKYTIVIL